MALEYRLMVTSGEKERVMTGRGMEVVLGAW